MSSAGTLAICDVVVVGAGIAGACTAFELRRRGYDVVLVDQRFPAFGASGRGPGMVWLQTRRAGIELRLAGAGKAKYAEYIDAIGDVFDYRADGGLLYFETEAQGRVVEDYVADRRRAGLDVELLSRTAAAERSPLLPATAIGAAWCADDAQIDSQAFVAALTAACVRMGVRSFENTPVLSTKRDGDRVVGVRTVRGDVHAGGVVWATGAWASNLDAEGLVLPVRSARMGHVVTQPIEPRPGPILHGPNGVHGCGALTELESFDPVAFGASGDDAAGGFGYDDYLASNRSGQLHVGGGIDGIGSLNPHVSARSTAAMVTRFVMRYPQFADCGITGLWAGLTSTTPDGLPIVDRVDGVFVNVAHEWGMASAPMCGQMAAELVAGEEGEFSGQLAATRPGLAKGGWEVE